MQKLASSLNLSKDEAQRSYDNYWTMNEGLGKLKENVERFYDTQGNKQFIPAWDGRLLFARGKNILINLAGQFLRCNCNVLCSLFNGYVAWGDVY